MNAFAPTPSLLLSSPPRHRFTADDVMRMVDVGLIDRDARMELMDGDLIDMPSEGELHINYKILLTRFFNRTLADDLWVAPDSSLHLAPTDAPEPDIYVVRAGARLKPVAPSDVLLVLEIADSSLGYDLGRKAAKYAAYGLREYWVVDVAARLTHVLHTPENGAYQVFGQVAFDQVLSSPALPGLALAIGTLPGLPSGAAAPES